jgi:hypothetical protein
VDTRSASIRRHARLSKLVKSLPAIFSFSIEYNFEPKLGWLGERLVLDDASLSVVVQQSPSLLDLNIETNLEPTTFFYEECVGLDAVTACITKSPDLCDYSLENRLKPRLAEVQEAGIPLNTGTISRMARYTELVWSNSMIFQKNKLLKN